MRHRSNARRAVSILAASLAIVAAVATAPAQQTPGVPHAPGPGGPATPAPGGPQTAPPVPGIPTLPSPEASASPATAGSPVPTGSSSPPAAGPPDANAPATPAPGAPIRFTGQLLDVRGGYVFFTTSDAFKASAAMRVIDLDDDKSSLTPQARIFARATLDPATGSITELALTKRRLPFDAAYQQAYARAHAFVVATSPTVAAPELAYRGKGKPPTGKPVAVTFIAQIPPTTPLTDTVYVTTDASGWVANAMRMDRVDAIHYRLTHTFASGTKFAYRYTRGSWTSVEVGQDGLQDDPHTFSVPEVDAQSVQDVIYRWSDQNPAQQQVGPDTIPTPFNPNPFGNLPSGIQHPGQPQPSPTPRP